eukprot:g33850.t1
MEPLRSGRRVHRGCPLSGQLYFLCKEPFLCLLLRRVSGLVLHGLGMGVVLLACTNDVLLMCSDSAYIGRMHKCLLAVSSARINWAKCPRILVSPWVGSCWVAGPGLDAAPGIGSQIDIQLMATAIQCLKTAVLGPIIMYQLEDAQ